MPLQPGDRPEPTQPRPRVLVLTSTFPRWAGDTEPRFVLDLCRALAPAFEVCVLAPHCAGAARREWLEGIEVRRFRYFFSIGERLAYDGGMLPKLRQEPALWLLVPLYLAALVLATLRTQLELKPDLVHAHWLIPQGIAAVLGRRLARRPVPVICTAHGADVFGLRGSLARMLRRRVAQDSATVAAVSAAVERALLDGGVARQRLRRGPMGIALGDSPGAGERVPGLIAFAGRLVEKKGVGVLIEAFALLARQRPEVRLRIAGGGPELERCRERARALGLDRVEFLGPVPHEQVLALFRSASVAVMPSLTAPGGDAEGLGLVMLEAMAAGCPVVVSDIPAVRDAVRPGENALVFPERDAAALCAALRRLLEEPSLAQRLSHQASRDVAERFGWGTVAANYRRLYDEALAGAAS